MPTSAATAADRCSWPAPGHQELRNLGSHLAGSLDNVVPAITQCRPVNECEAIVSLHVTETIHPLMTDAPIKLDQQGIVVVTDIGEVGQAVPPPLSVPVRQTVRSFYLPQLRHLQARFGADGNITQQVVDQAPMSLPPAGCQCLG
jgi:hypothetical protein